MWRYGLRFGSVQQTIAAAFAIAAILGLAYWFYGEGLYKPAVVQWARVTVTDPGGKYRVSAATRRVIIGRQTRSFWQVEVSPDKWLDCGNDCAATLRKAAFP